MEINSNNKTIFVGGISMKTKYEDLKNHFSKYGKVVKITIPYKKDQKEIKGYALVTYQNIEDFHACLQENHVINQRKIYCTPVTLYIY